MCPGNLECAGWQVPRWRRRWSCGRRRCERSRRASACCSPKPAWWRRRACSWMACSGRSGARPAGCGPRRRATLGRGVSRRSSAAAGGMRTPCATWCATTRWRRWPTRMRCWRLTRRAFSSRASRLAGSGASIRGLRARSPTARSGCSRPTCPGTAMRSLTGHFTCRKPGRTTRRGLRRRTCRREPALPPSRGWPGA